MPTDRTTKMLLALIEMALWGLILRPALTPVPAQAQGAAAEQTPNLVGIPAPEVRPLGVAVYFASGPRVYRLDPVTLKSQATFDAAAGP